ncbi:MAG: hypothetical protein IKN43_11875 [Selenomonadaceae bacterium]|nr:hypothetical protein [Selenomonadaceae bacterium]
MARARNIKPGFFINDDLAEIEPMGRLLFIGLWTIADREGRLEDRPKRIKGQIFPYDNCDIEFLLNELQKWGFINRYQGKKTSGDDVNIIQVINFKKHQNPHVKEKASELLAYGENISEIKKEDIQPSLFDDRTRIFENPTVENFADSSMEDYEKTMEENFEQLCQIAPNPQEISNNTECEISTVQAPYLHQTDPAESSSLDSSTLITENLNIEVEVDRAREEKDSESKFDEILTYFSRNIHPVINDVEKNTLEELLKTYGYKWCVAAFEDTAKRNVKNIMYPVAILKRWAKEGFQSDSRKKNKAYSPTKTYNPDYRNSSNISLTDTDVKVEKAIELLYSMHEEEKMIAV